MIDEDWRDSAACSRVDPELFFPSKDHNSARDAKRICSRCLVAVECLAAARPDDFGIWAGLTARQRTVPGRRRGRTRKATT